MEITHAGSAEGRSGDIEVTWIMSIEEYQELLGEAEAEVVRLELAKKAKETAPDAAE